MDINLDWWKKKNKPMTKKVELTIDDIGKYASTVNAGKQKTVRATIYRDHLNFMLAELYNWKESHESIIAGHKQIKQELIDKNKSLLTENAKLKKEMAKSSKELTLEMDDVKLNLAQQEEATRQMFQKICNYEVVLKAAKKIWIVWPFYGRFKKLIKSVKV